MQRFCHCQRLIDDTARELAHAELASSGVGERKSNHDVFSRHPWKPLDLVPDPQLLGQASGVRQNRSILQHHRARLHTFGACGKLGESPNKPCRCLIKAKSSTRDCHLSGVMKHNIVGISDLLKLSVPVATIVPLRNLYRVIERRVNHRYAKAQPDAVWPQPGHHLSST